MIRLFISHSSRDQELAGLLVELFRAGLELSPSEIRCTSVDGYRLEIGADTEDQLREEILEAPAFLGLISEAALGSSYVLFELGARWGAKLHIAPLLASTVDHRLLPGPISGKNALRAGRSEDLHQMLGDIGKVLELGVKNPPLVEKYVKAITRHETEACPESEEPDAVPHASPSSPHVANSEYRVNRMRGLVETQEAAEEIAKRACESRWPDDFRMRQHCTDQQRSAHRALTREPPSDVPIDVFVQIRQMCQSRWPDDFRMRLHCENQQLQSWRDLQDGTDREENA